MPVSQGIIGGHSIWRSELMASITLADPEPWMDDAACTGRSELFLAPRSGKAAAQARAICSGCVVAVSCRRWNEEQEAGTTNVAGLAGIYAGETPKERAARRKWGG
jgi:hypothetical protein